MTVCSLLSQPTTGGILSILTSTQQLPMIKLYSNTLVTNHHWGVRLLLAKWHIIHRTKSLFRLPEKTIPLHQESWQKFKRLPGSWELPYQRRNQKYPVITSIGFASQGTNKKWKFRNLKRACYVGNVTNILSSIPSRNCNRNRFHSLCWLEIVNRSLK
jgi:hypothetical protein